MSETLPYHCPTLNGNFFKPPCERQIAEAKEKRAKFPHIMRGFLEKCLECGGKGLVKREGVEAPVIISSTTNEVAKINTPPDCQNERENMTEIMTAQEAPPAPRCQKHPTEPQVQCGPDSKRAGQYLGACKVCMAGRKVGRKAGNGKTEKMTPAVDRDLGCAVAKKDEPVIQTREPVEESKMAGVVAFKTQEEAERVLGPGKIPAAEFVPSLCPRPDCEAPGSPVKIDKLNRSMGMCAACVSARGRRVGVESHKLGKTAPPVSIPLNQGRYADIKAWLEAQADENERTLQAEVMFRLKMAMREAAQ